MLPCKGNDIVRDNRKWYSPNWTERGKVTFCEECYHQFVKDTSLSGHIRNDGEFEACCCDFNLDMKKQWELAVNKDDIEQFQQYLDKIEKFNLLKAKMDIELARQRALLKQKGEVIALSLLSDDSEDKYQYNGYTYGNRYDAESRQI